jgi:hypothetical protein
VKTHGLARGLRRPRSRPGAAGRFGYYVRPPEGIILKLIRSLDL